MKNKLPGFKKCMAMMRKRDPQAQEDGFHFLLPHAAEYVPELIKELEIEKDEGLRCWLLELIGSARSPLTFDVLVEQLRAEEPSLRGWALWGLKLLNTKEARTILWEARSWTFGSPEETEEFRKDLDSLS